MTVSTKPRVFNTAVITTVIVFGLGISLVAGLVVAGYTQESPYAQFKLAGVATDCVVARLERPRGAVRGEVGLAGGELLSDAEARGAYNCAKSAMAAAYAKSGNVGATKYSTWANFSTSPYVSAPHGNRYVNNYANPVAARQYAKYEKGGEFPIGSVLAKDSFVVNADGRVLFGVLSLMEKMPAGFNPEAADWRYSMVMPDGSEFGTTGGLGSEKVKFCAGCHGVVDRGVYFVPQRHRFDAEAP